MSRVKKSRRSKFIALVVALTFLLSVAAPAFAAAPANLQNDAAARLKTLGILEGFPDGSLGLDQTMTRAQFAKVITIATGNSIIADAMVNSPTKFPDAKVGVWYTGYVNVASELGYILGYPDGTFKPNATITNAEAVTILLRALGYDDRLPGSWPTDYLVKANELEITKDVTFAAKAAALRGDVAIFTSRTLDTNMVKWDSDANEFVERVPAITLLARSFKGTTEEGYLVDLNWDGGKLMATIAYFDKDGKLATKDYEVVSQSVVSGAEGILDLLAKKVSYVLNSDDQIIYFGDKSTDTVVDNDGEINISDGKVTNLNKKSYTLDTSGVGYQMTAFPGTVPSVIYKADKITGVLDGGKVINIFFENYGKPGIVKSISGESITVVSGTSGGVNLKDKDYAVIKDGNLASLSDLEVGDLIYTVSGTNDAHGLDYLIIAVSKDKAIEGTLEKANADFSKITVDGVEYNVDKDDAVASSDGGSKYVSWNATSTNKSDFMGKDVAILLSPAGKVSVITSDFKAEKGLYGILLDASVSGFEGKVKVLTAAGDKVTFDVDEDNITVDSVNKIVYESTSAIIKVNDLFSYTLNSKGEIDSVTMIVASDTVNGTDKDNNRIQLNSKWYRVTDSTVFFGQDSNGDWQTVSWSTFAKAVVNKTVYYKDDGNTVTAVAYKGAVTAAGDYGVILGSGHDADGAYYRLMVLGSEVKYNLPKNAPLADNVVGSVYDFTLSADNRITLTNTVGGQVYGQVASFTAGDFIELGNGNFYDLDSETSIVDVTDSTKPAVVDSVGTGDWVVLFWNDDDWDGFVDYILIVKEADKAKYGGTEVQ